MKKRIYRNVLALLLLCIVLLSGAVCAVFTQRTRQREMSSVQDRAVLMAELLNRGIHAAQDDGRQEGFEYADFISGETNARLAIIAPDGTVLLDSKSYAETLPKHDDRQEVIDAFTNGSGEALRQSETLGSMSYYYAILLDDGNVLRISEPMQSFSNILRSLLPAICAIAVLILLLTYLLTRRLTRTLLAPIYALDLDGHEGSEYEELAPYERKIRAQRRQIEGQVQQLETRMQLIESIAEHMREGLLFLNHSGQVILANASACNIFDQQELRNENVLDFCRDLSILEDIKRTLSGEATRSNLQKGGRLYRVHASPVYEEGQITGSILLLMDITDRQAAQLQRREFSANVSHEMKTPLTTIYGLAEMIETGMAQPQDIPVFGGKISAQAKRLIAIIEDIIKLSEFDEGSRVQERDEVDLYQCAAHVLRDVKEKAEARGITLSLEGAHPQVLASGRLMDELIYNLVENAIKYNRESGSVTVTLTQEEQGCLIAVSDTGIGIAPEHLERIFERFYRVDRSRSKKTGGTGLGLSIVKHIAEYYNGKAWAQSTPDVGTTIYCRLQLPVNEAG